MQLTELTVLLGPLIVALVTWMSKFLLGGKVPKWVLPIVVVPALSLGATWVSSTLGTGTGSEWLDFLLGLLAVFFNQAKNQLVAGNAEKVSPAKLTGGAAGVVAIFLTASSLFSPVVAQAQTWESKTLWEPDYTVGLVSLHDNPSGEGVVADITPGIGLGVAYSQVSSTNGEDWDVTEWSVAFDPLYIERDVSGSLFWKPGVKGTVFNEYLQVYLCYTVGSISDTRSRIEVKFGTSLTGIWDGLTGAVGL